MKSAIKKKAHDLTQIIVCFKAKTKKNLGSSCNVLQSKILDLFHFNNYFHGKKIMHKMV